MLLSFSKGTHAAQSGPFFPTHRFPTDRSFHVGYDFSWLKSTGNFDSTSEKVVLDTEGSITRLRHTIRPEYQPSRQFAFGAFFNFDGVRADDGTGIASSKNTFSDQVIWGEFRVFDIPGASIGLASVVKFPLYSNPTIDDLDSTDPDPGTIVLMGDAQTDFSLLATTELWPNDFLRFQGDFGFTYRSDFFAAELPYLVTFGFVTQKVDLSFMISGNFSLGNDDLSETDPEAAANIAALRQAFSGSNYALVENPSLTKLGVNAELWFDPRWGVATKFEVPIRGNNSVFFWNFALGMTYRWAESNRVPKRTAREIGIDVDQEEGRFEAEEVPSDDEFF